MANRTRQTQMKREKERRRLEKQADKAAKRVEARERKANAPERAGGEDPDIAGIVPGPQPIYEGN